MNTFDSFAIILLAAAIHASFQLSVSMLTLLSGHAFGKKTAHSRVVGLAFSFSGGALLMTLFGLAFFALVFLNFDGIYELSNSWWVILAVAAAAVGVAVWAAYYRPSKTGTSLWIPRAMARFLHERTKATKNNAEAFGLGLTSVVAETIFILVPMLIAAFLIVQLPTAYQLLALIAYTLVAHLPLFAITFLIGGGHSVAKIQKWREHNKRFLQFAAGSALIVLGVYFYVDIFTTFGRGGVL